MAKNITKSIPEYIAQQKKANKQKRRFKLAVKKLKNEKIASILEDFGYVAKNKPKNKKIIIKKNYDSDYKFTFFKNIKKKRLILNKKNFLIKYFSNYNKNKYIFNKKLPNNFKINNNNLKFTNKKLIDNKTSNNLKTKNSTLINITKKKMLSLKNYQN